MTVLTEEETQEVAAGGIISDAIAVFAVADAAYDFCKGFVNGLEGKP